MHTYLKSLHVGFQCLYRSGALKNNPVYIYHYFTRHLICEGDYVLDIGANLGYYTTLFSGRVGKTGRVYAVEPVQPFFDTLRWATRNRDNVTLYHCALGAENRSITLGTPGKYGYLRTGLARVSDDTSSKDAEFSFPAEMKKASELFEDLPRLDYIKCDIEGYETIVIPEIQPLLEQFKPPIQIESWLPVAPFLQRLGYQMHQLQNGRLVPLTHGTGNQKGDRLFIHKDNTRILERLAAKHLPEGNRTFPTSSD